MSSGHVSWVTLCLPENTIPLKEIISSGMVVLRWWFMECLSQLLHLTSHEVHMQAMRSILCCSPKHTIPSDTKPLVTHWISVCIKQVNNLFIVELTWGRGGKERGWKGQGVEGRERGWEKARRQGAGERGGNEGLSITRPSHIQRSLLPRLYLPLYLHVSNNPSISDLHLSTYL